MAGAIMDKVWGLFGGVGQEAEDFDIDSQLANAALEHNEVEAQAEPEIRPRKIEKKQCISNNFSLKY